MMKKAYIAIMLVMLITAVSAKAAVTVITHGVRPLNDFPAWTLNMAEAVKERLGEGSIYVYDLLEEDFIRLQGYGNSDEAILIFDWSNASNENYTGFSEAAGDALFAGLISGEEKGMWTLDRVHFIGHSRGPVVNSEAIERLLKVKGAAANIHVTTLDPTDVSLPVGDSDVNGDGLPPVVIWKGVEFADNYFRKRYCLGESLADFDGIFIEGAVNTDLTGRGICLFPPFSTTIDHSAVHAWYLGTIDTAALSEGLTLIHDDWYIADGAPPREKDGYYFSYVAGGERPTLYSGARRPVQVDWLNDAEHGLVNGNFNRGPQGFNALANSLPGWGWVPKVPGDTYLAYADGGHLVLSENGTMARHNRFYMPPETRSVAFEYLVTSPSPNDALRISLISDLGNVSVMEVSDLKTAGNDWASVRVDASGIAGGTGAMVLELVGGNDGVGATVWVDNVEFTSIPVESKDDGSDTDVTGGCFLRELSR